MSDAGHRSGTNYNDSTGTTIGAKLVTDSGVNLLQYPVYCRTTDVSTAGSYWVVAPHSGTIDLVYTALHGTIATADADVTLELGGTLVTNSTVTITASGSAAGDKDSATPTAANTVTAGQMIEVITDGASTNTVAVDVTILITRT